MGVPHQRNYLLPWGTNTIKYWIGGTPPKEVLTTEGANLYFVLKPWVVTITIHRSTPYHRKGVSFPHSGYVLGS